MSLLWQRVTENEWRAGRYLAQNAEPLSYKTTHRAPKWLLAFDGTALGMYPTRIDAMNVAEKHAQTGQMPPLFLRKKPKAL